MTQYNSTAGQKKGLGTEDGFFLVYRQTQSKHHEMKTCPRCACQAQPFFCGVCLPMESLPFDLVIHIMSFAPCLGVTPERLVHSRASLYSVKHPPGLQRATLRLAGKTLYVRSHMLGGIHVKLLSTDDLRRSFTQQRSSQRIIISEWFQVKPTWWTLLLLNPDGTMTLYSSSVASLDGYFGSLAVETVLQQLPGTKPPRPVLLHPIVVPPRDSTTDMSHLSIRPLTRCRRQQGMKTFTIQSRPPLRYGVEMEGLIFSNIVKFHAASPLPR
jgi:hypothetical protein